MRVFSYLLEHKAALLLVFVLLACQAMCELALPSYTSNIVDVGIQQSGVENVSPSVMTADTFDMAAMLLSDSDEALLRESYDRGDDGNYHLNAQGESHRAQLDGALEIPLIAINYLDEASGEEGGTASAASEASSTGAISITDATDAFNLRALKAAYAAGQISKEQIQQGLDQALGQMGELSDSLLEQQALAATKAEYERAGVDLSQVQMDYLLRMGMVMMLIAFGVLISNLLVDLVASRTGAKIGRDLRSRLFARVATFSKAEINKFSAASLITRGTNDIQNIQMVCVLSQRMVLYSPIMAIGGIVMVAQTNLSMAWIILLGVVAVVAVVMVLIGITMPKFKIMQKLVDRVNLVSREILTGLPVIRAFGREQHEEERFDEASANLKNTQLFTNRVMAFMMPAMTLVMNLMSVLIVWVGGHAINDGTLQTGEMIAYITYSMIIVASFLMLGGVAIVLPRANVAAERIWEVITTEPSIRDPEPNVTSTPYGRASSSPAPAPIPYGRTSSSPGALEARPYKKVGSPVALEAQPSAEGETQATFPKAANAEAGVAIEFDHVSFRYGESDKDVLEDISFVAEPGKTTAIVGSTGCGKSTVMQLIERFYDVTAGAVRVDGIDVRDMPVEHLRAQFGYVPQKAFLFKGTVESNIAYSDSGMAEDRVEAALEIAQAKEFVDALPKGVKAPIAQGGTNVSGGQRQRLAIARALARDARGYLFDDSFSALDYKTDAALRAELNTRLGGSTVVIVAQRIATVMYADKIVCLNEGRVVGQGTHAELLATCADYRDIAASQFSEEELQAALEDALTPYGRASGSPGALEARPYGEGETRIEDDAQPAEGGER